MIRTYFVIRGLIFTFLGVLLLLWPKAMLTGVVIVCALESIFSLIYTLFFLNNIPDSYGKNTLISTALVQLIMSLLILVFPETIQILLSFFVIILALGIVWSGISLIIKSKENGYFSGVQVLWGIGFIFGGGFIMAHAFFMVITLISLIGAVMCIGGIRYLLIGWKESQHTKQSFEDLEEDDE